MKEKSLGFLKKKTKKLKVKEPSVEKFETDSQ